MVAHDLDQARRHVLLQKHGFSVAVGKEDWSHWVDGCIIYEA
jgi:hypothetical protein